MPGDAEFRYKLFAPILRDLYENKIVYFERFVCVAILENIQITSERFEATAVPYINIERPDKPYHQKKPWTFSASWPYMRVLNGHFGTYGMWSFWTDKELVKTVEELARKGEFEKALDLTVYKEINKLRQAPTTPSPNAKSGE
jgi:hypothetical protein